MADNGQHKVTEQLIEEFLDGRLAPAEREAFARMIADSDELREQIQLQQQIDGGMRRLFNPPPARDIKQHVQPLLEGSADPGADFKKNKIKDLATTKLSRWQLVAASVLLAVGIAAYVGWSLRDQKPVGPDPFRDYGTMAKQSLFESYQYHVATGFSPAWVCKDDQEFASTFQTRLGQPLLLSRLPEGFEALGLSYANTITPQTICLLARVHGSEVMVFIDLAQSDRGQHTVPEASGLHVFEKNIGKLVLSELAAQPQPHILPLFYQPK